jgi:hypothetical protein
MTGPLERRPKGGMRMSPGALAAEAVGALRRWGGSAEGVTEIGGLASKKGRLAPERWLESRDLGRQFIILRPLGFLEDIKEERGREFRIDAISRRERGGQYSPLIEVCGIIGGVRLQTCSW